MRGLQSMHIFKGQEHGEQLAAWLNANTGCPLYVEFADMILSMIDDTSGPQHVGLIVRRLIGELSKNPQAKLNEIMARGEREREAERFAAEYAKVAMNRIFPSIRIVPVKLPRSDETIRWAFEWVYQSDAPVPEGVGDALYRFVRLAESGRLRRMRRCRSCVAWLYAKFERQWYCSGPCREKAFRHSATGKEKRRKYMQRYRANLERMQRNYLKVSRRVAR
jgi:hypothetical protein